MNSEAKQELTYILFIELLAYQFASPVRWIETQDQILRRQNAQRIIEFGPTKTLTNMLKHTYKSTFAEYDEAHGFRRQFLAFLIDVNAVYYNDVSDDEVQTDSRDSAMANLLHKSSLKEDKSPSGPSVRVHSDSIPVAAIPDVDSQPPRLTDKLPAPADIIRIMLGIKLKKPQDDIALSTTIRELASGRSSLQNEIVGDFSEEFSNIPSQVEDTPLEELGHMIQSMSLTGGLGKKSSTLVQRMISSTMPAGMTLSTIRTYLEIKWGLGPGRQDGVLLETLLIQPASRLATVKEAHELFDAAVARYSKSVNLNITPQAVAVAIPRDAAMDPAILQSFTRNQDPMMTDLIDLVRRYFQIDRPEVDMQLAEAQQRLLSLENELGQWRLEHGTAYERGVLPMFDQNKVRDHSSYWNWVLQDQHVLWDRIRNRSCTVPEDLSKAWHSILNRSDARVLDHFIYLKKQAAEASHPGRGECRRLSGLLCEESIHRDPTFKSFLPPKWEADLFLVRDDICQAEQSRPMLARRAGQTWVPSPQLTSLYFASLANLRDPGLTFRGKVALLTGAGRGSIGAEILKGLLNGGAHVVTTTSSFSSDVARYFRDIYQAEGARGSRLVLVPFNQGSKGDVESLVEYIFTSDRGGLQWDLDYIIPFAAISESGRDIASIDGKSELAHRAMMTNIVRLLGEVKRRKEELGFTRRPSHVLLPLSPNHGTFGGDGLYSESKVSLEILFSKWFSEGWSDYISLMGVDIGWTRGTSLMASNDRIADDVELEMGIHTFSVEEMACHILGLMEPQIMSHCEDEPVYADLTGGLKKVASLKAGFDKVRRRLEDEAKLDRALRQEAHAHEITRRMMNHVVPTIIKPRPQPILRFPRLPDYRTDVTSMSALYGLLDIDRVVVITGLAEIGPHGNSRTRWEIEVGGDYSPEGYVEMAWLMGLIRHQSDIVASDGEARSGWVDVKDGDLVHEGDVEVRYGSFIRQHCGIRPIEPTLDNGYDPMRKRTLHEVVIHQDLPPIEVSEVVADEIKREHQEKVELLAASEPGMRRARFRKGAVLMLPKAHVFNRDVAGQIPTGWNAKMYGIPDEIVNSVDRATLYALVCTAEALISCGITDPYELYRYIHVSEIGNCIGSGAGGLSSITKMYQDRFLDKPLPQDIIQETFVNTPAAWINMLLFSASGPIKTPVGACATSLESLDTAYEMIVAKKAKFCLVGSVDDLTEETSYEFGMMGATIDTHKDAGRGRSPPEMSRPATDSRAGFVEAHGCGVQIVTSARLAIDMGLPIQGIVAYTGMAGDKIGRSVPAPGKGVTTLARESQPGGVGASPLLDIGYRRRRLEHRLRQIDELEGIELAYLEGVARKAEVRVIPEHQEDGVGAGAATAIPGEAQRELADLDDGQQARRAQLLADTHEQRQDARYLLGGNAFYRSNPRIAPLRGALAAWNLTVDDLAFASLHGTSTPLNDTNEAAVLQAQFQHLGRSKGNPIWALCQKYLTGHSKGNPIWALCQKYLTGHSKGAAGAWALNGCLQAMNDGVVPGNRNADNIDAALKQYDHIVYPSRNISIEDIKAFTVTNFGFGQKGAQVIEVHSKFLYALLSEEEYATYVSKRQRRWHKAQRAFHHSLVNNAVVRVKEQAPYRAGEEEMRVLLDPCQRLAANGSWISKPA